VGFGLCGVPDTLIGEVLNKPELTGPGRFLVPDM
jgi:hypothetical protein